MPIRAPGLYNWTYTRNQPGGSELCTVNSDNTAEAVWSATKPMIVGVASGSDGNTLQGWWNKSSGPYEKLTAVSTSARGL